jgi:hypothetical protein
VFKSPRLLPFWVGESLVGKVKICTFAVHTQKSLFITYIITYVKKIIVAVVHGPLSVVLGANKKFQSCMLERRWIAPFN